MKNLLVKINVSFVILFGTIRFNKSPCRTGGMQGS